MLTLLKNIFMALAALIEKIFLADELCSSSDARREKRLRSKQETLLAGASCRRVGPATDHSGHILQKAGSHD